MVKTKISAVRPVSAPNGGAPYLYARIVAFVRCSCELSDVIESGAELQKWLDAFRTTVNRKMIVPNIHVESVFGRTFVKTEFTLYDIPSYEWLESVGVSTK